MRSPEGPKRFLTESLSGDCPEFGVTAYVRAREVDALVRAAKAVLKRGTLEAYTEHELADALRRAVRAIEDKED